MAVYGGARLPVRIEPGGSAYAAARRGRGFFDSRGCLRRLRLAAGVEA